MTHEELLAKMAEPAHNLNANDARNVYLLALRAVVELHKPTGVFCAGCGEYYDACTTIRTIEAALK